AELVADHRFGDEHGDVLAAIMHGDGVPDHLGNDHGAARPRLDDVLGALLVLLQHLLHEVVVDERPLLKATWHQSCSLPLLLATPTHDEPVAGLALLTGPALGLTPRADGVAATGGPALTTTVRVVDRVHRHTTDARALALPPHPAGLTPADVGVFDVADLAHSGPACDLDLPHLARGHTQGGVGTLLGEELDRRSGRTAQLGTAARLEL